MITLKKQFFLYVLMVLPLAMLSQELCFKNANLNLPSQETYFVFQDSKGYIWIATEFGLVKYNGQIAENINLKSKHSNEAVYAIHEDEKGLIRLVTSKQRILEYDNNKIIEPIYSKKMVAFINNPKDLLYSICKNKNNLIINSRFQTYKINLTNNQVRAINLSKNYTIAKKSSALYVIKDKDKEEINAKFLTIDWTDFSKKNYSKTIALNSIDWRNKVLQIKKTTFFCIGNVLVSIDTNGKILTKTFSSLITSISYDTKNGLFVGLFKNGLRYFANHLDLENGISSLENFSVTSATTDYEGNLWCSTLEKGVFLCKNTSILVYNTPELSQKASFLKKINNSVYTSTNLKNIFAFADNKIIKHNLNLEIERELTDIVYFDNTFYISNKSFLAYTNDFKNYKKIKYNQLNNGILQLLPHQKQLFALNGDEIFEIKNKKLIPIYKKVNFRAKKLIVYSNSEFLIGCENGLFVLDYKKNSLKKFNNLNAEITAIAKDKNQNYWIGTKGDGLYLLENNKLKKKLLIKNNNPKYITDIQIDNNKIWITSNIGIFKIGNQIENFDLKDGIISQDCNKIAIHDNKVYVSGIDGIFSFNENSNFKSTAKPKIYLKKINNLVLQKPLKEINLKYNYEKLRLDFDILSFKNQEENQLFYKIIDLNNKFKSTKENELHIDNLLPGNYQLVVFASNLNSQSQPITLKINIEAPFWGKWWFKTLSVLLLIGLIYLLVKRKLNKIKQKEKAQTKLNNLISQSQLKALQAQMNPHFIFNSLNSIQNFIIQNNTIEAYDYLSKFSKLIRLVLENSEKQTISIDNEINMLKLYLKLEQLRFKNKFKTNFVVDPTLDLYNNYIPTMIIQPFVENAIWHGIMNLETHENGEVLISFKKLNHKTILISVEDTGVGIEKANQLKNKKHKSFGNQLINKRIDLINFDEKSEFKIVLTVSDLNPNRYPKGTKIVLEITTL